MIQHLQEPVLPMNHTCWLKCTWMISCAIWTCQISKQNFLAPGFRAGIFCVMILRYVFNMGTIKNSRISSPWKMVSCFAIMFVPLWKFLAMNIIQISGACSLVRQKWAWSLFYSTTEIRFPSVPLAHAANKKESYESVKLLLGKIKYDELKWKLRGDLKLWHFYSECNSVTQNTAVSCASGTAGTRRIPM